MTPAIIRTFPVRRSVAPSAPAPARPDWRENVLLGSLWLAFIGLAVRAIAVDDDLVRNGGRLLIDIAGTGFVAVGLTRLRAIVNSPIAPRYTAIFILLATCLLAAGTGLVKGNAFLLWVVMGVLPLLSVAVVFAVPHDERFPERLFNVLIWQTVAGVLFATYVILFEPIPSRAVWNGLNGDGLGKTAARCLYATPFLLAAFSRLKPWQALLAVTAWLELTVLSVLGASRGLMTVTFFLIPAIIAIVAFRTKARMGRFVTPLLLASTIVGVLIAGAAASGRYSDVGPYLYERWESALERFAETSPDELSMQRVASGTVDSAKQEFLEGSSRGGEFQDFISQLTPVDYVFGRGFGGTWLSTYWGQEWLIVHIGIGHLILVGGVPLLLAFSWVLIRAAITAWTALPFSAPMAGTFAYLVVFTQSFLQHGAIQDEIEVYFFWLCVGLTLSTTIGRVARRPRPAPLPRGRRLAS